MAISTGSQILYSDLAAKYTSFNTFINTYGGGEITALTIPSSGQPARASDINDLDDKITEFQNDVYFSTQPTWWVNSSVTIGDLIMATDMSGINTTESNFSRVKCRNADAHHAYSQNTNACAPNTCSVEECSNTCTAQACNKQCSQGGHTHGNNSNSCSHSAHSQSGYTHGNNSNSCSHSSHSQGGHSHGNNSNSCSHSAHSQACGRQCTITCNNTCGSWGTCSKNCSEACGHLANNGWKCNNYGSYRGYQNCTNGTRTKACDKTCSYSSNSQSCNYSSHTQTGHTHGKNSNTCSNTCTQGCGSRTCSRTCSNTCAQGCSRSCSRTCSNTCTQACSRTCSNSCTHSTNSNACTHSSHNNTGCSYATHGETCKHQTYIDISNAHTNL